MTNDLLNHLQNNTNLPFPDIFDNWNNPNFHKVHHIKDKKPFFLPGCNYWYDEEANNLL